MMACWHLDEDERPSFETICTKLMKIISDIDSDYVTKYTLKNSENWRDSA
jgi:hypothetical protein